MEIQPAGRYFATDVHEAGGVGLVARELQKRELSTRARGTSTAARSVRSPTPPSRRRASR